MRITGLATGMDIDEIVKSTMKSYRIKIDEQKQKKDILEIKQQLYRDLINDSRELYNKYFDVTKNDSILLSKNWSTVKFQSSNDSVVTVTGGSDAKAGNYTITGTAATAAKLTMTETLTSGSEIEINGKKFTLTGDSQKAIADNLNKSLKDAGINVSVKYTDFAGTESTGNKSGFVFESTVLGPNASFTIGGNFIDATNNKTGENATGATLSGFTVKNLKDANGQLVINGEVIDIPEIMNDTYVNSDIEKILQEKLADKKLTVKIDEAGNMTFSSTNLGTGVKDIDLKINGISGTFKPGTDATASVCTLSPSEIAGKTISINGKVIDMSKIGSKDTIQFLNEEFSKQNIGANAELKDGNIVITSKGTGTASALDVKIASSTDATAGFKTSSVGTNANIVIKDGNGGVYLHEGNSNSITLDGITFKITGDIPSEGIKITGKNDTENVKKQIVAFVNDYNTLMEKLNKLTMEKRAKNYNPLTDEQKKEMSEEEIKLWNEKVKQGQLYKDSDVTRIANSMKEAMRTLVDGVGGGLEKFGIVPVADYQGTKNGTFTIDDTKLTAALENNPEEVMNLFISTPPADDSLSEAEKNSKTGVAQRLKNILYNETVTVSSSLIKKAGVLGTSTASNNDLTKSIEKYERKMEDMEKDFTRREQLLYSKWATVETMMNNLNTQQNYLLSQLGS